MSKRFFPIFNIYSLRFPHLLHLPSDITKLSIMASRNASRALRSSLAQLAKPAVQRRTFVVAANAVRSAAPKAAVSTSFQQTRGVKTIDFAGTTEKVYGMTFSLTIYTSIADHLYRARRLAKREAPRESLFARKKYFEPVFADKITELLQERHSCPHRIRIARSRPRS